MDVREKLLEIMEDLGCNDEYCKDCEFCNDIDGCVHRQKEIIADRLIANGVTVQEWVPAEEPPEEYRDEYGELIPFLVCEEGTDYPFRAFYDGKNWGDGIFAISVKWWMRLPAPPKEKERKNGDGNV